MVSPSIALQGIGPAQASLGRLEDAAATAGGARLFVFSNLPYAAPIETGRYRNGRVARLKGGAWMFRRGAQEGIRGFEQELAAALPHGRSAVAQAYLSCGRRVVEAVRRHTPVVSGALRESVTMRLEIDTPRAVPVTPSDRASVFGGFFGRAHARRGVR
jgi:hypothetical protein